MTDSQRIAVIFDRSERIERALYGEEGMVAGFAVMRTEVDTLKNSVPSGRERKAAWAAIVTALIGMAGTVGTAVLGR